MAALLATPIAGGYGELPAEVYAEVWEYPGIGLEGMPDAMVLQMLGIAMQRGRVGCGVNGLRGAPNDIGQRARWALWDEGVYAAETALDCQARLRQGLPFPYGPPLREGQALSSQAWCRQRRKLLQEMIGSSKLERKEQNELDARCQELMTKALRDIAVYNLRRKAAALLEAKLRGDA